MQRVRIGLTGLGFVFIAVLLAMALTRAPDAEAPITANSVAAGVPAPANVQSPQEPLAELGVAPRSPDSNSSVNLAAPAPPQ
jgi:hypothetical protein